MLCVDALCLSLGLLYLSVLYILSVVLNNTACIRCFFN